ncbi:MAG: CocE/NonD family hydrolase [Caldilineaceae bacterium]|nr:CocE/NonD family hydrolase [Caldilineaceae bacterium]
MVFNVRDHLVQIKTDFPYAIRQLTHVWIPMADGVRLAARIWLPVDAEASPVPALLEYIPYRKNDSTALRDSIRHPYFAGYGYASVRVDMRGSGDSEGVMLDEYAQQELDDAVEVIAWLARQPWCSGNVGMFGKSWGGFNALQVAAMRPPALKAIITLCSTDDRYADDVHYMGGCMLGSAMLYWASIMLAYNARPPDPKFVGEAWRAMWRERLEQTPPFVEQWVAHQRRDAYWQHGSVCEDFANIECAVFAVGGWTDGYTNAILRMLEGLSCPKLGLIGPWAHEYPEVAVPGPQIGFLQECLRWWDHWLKGAETGIMDEPLLRTYLMESVRPATFYEYRAGRWVAEMTWSSPQSTNATYWLEHGQKLADKPPADEQGMHCAPVQTHGLYAGVWCPFGSEGDLASDQRVEDGLSLCFTTEPLRERSDYLGFPDVTLTLSADRPDALVAVRLCDVASDGASTLVSWGLLNLTHRESHEHPALLTPGQRYTVTVRLNAIGYTMPAGHRWRLAIAPTFWPHAWPSPEPATLTIYPGHGTHLAMPVRPRAEAVTQQDEQVTFLPPEISPLLTTKSLRNAERMRTIQNDLKSQVVQLTDYLDEGARQLLPDGIEFEHVTNDTYTIAEGDPLSARVRCEHTLKLGRGDWRVRIETASEMSADATHFYLENTLTAFDGETPFFTRTWQNSFPRACV